MYFVLFLGKYKNVFIILMPVFPIFSEIHYACDCDSSSFLSCHSCPQAHFPQFYEGVFERNIYMFTMNIKVPPQLVVIMCGLLFFPWWYEMVAHLWNSSCLIMSSIIQAVLGTEYNFCSFSHDSMFSLFKRWGKRPILTYIAYISPFFLLSR